VSRIITGASSRNLLKFAVVIGYLAVLMASLFGASPTRAQMSPTITVTPTPTSMLTPVASKLTVKPETLTFGIQIVLPPVGTVSKPKNITLSVAKNQPDAVTIELPLLISDATGPPAQFTVQPNDCGVIQPGTSCSVPIVFQPNGAKHRTALMLITSNASNGVQSVNLIGHGKQAILSIRPTALSFPVTKVGELARVSRQIVLTNKNSLPIVIHAITSSNSTVFPITQDCPPMLQPGAQCTISVGFMASRNGTIPGRIAIVDNAAGPNHILLSGGGKGGPVITPTASPTQTPLPTATFTPATFPMRTFPVMH
jgi:hypothetical protein